MALRLQQDRPFPVHLRCQADRLPLEPCPSESQEPLVDHQQCSSDSSICQRPSSWKRQPLIVQQHVNRLHLFSNNNNNNNNNNNYKMWQFRIHCNLEVARRTSRSALFWPVWLFRGFQSKFLHRH